MDALLPLMARLAAPGPLMVKFWLSASVPEVSVMVPLTLKLIVSPGAAAAMTDRSVPDEPSSARLVTGSVAAKPGTAALRVSRLTASVQREAPECPSDD